MSVALAAALFCSFPPSRLFAQVAGSVEPPRATYWLYVANESSDLVSRVRYGPSGLVEEKTIPVGIMPADLDGAHGLTVSPDGKHWYISLAHGTPYGRVWRFRTGTDEFIDSATAGLFPATMGITPDGSMLFAVNFNLHGNHVPSSVSAFFTLGMQEMTQITTCTMPHGSAVNRAGTRHYSTCMMDDQLVEISTARLEVSRRLHLASGHVLAADAATPHGTGAGHAPSCRPTWVAVAPDDRHLYVPCNGAGEVLEIDAVSFAITRRLATGLGPYNAAVSPDGRVLVVTLKGEQKIAVFDLETGSEHRAATSQPITHGVVISPDSRFAFVTNEAIGAVRGTLDAFDLRTGARLASVDLQHQPGGVGFWKMEAQ